MVKILLGKGAYCDMRFIYGDTPLYLAAEAGHREVVDILTCFGADIEESNPLRKMSFEAAFLKWDTDIARSLHDSHTECPRLM
jgi:ankyrin repeat protein